MKIFNRTKKTSGETRSFFPYISNYYSNGVFSCERSSAVDTVVSKIANTIAILPLKAYIHTPKGITEAWWTNEGRLLRDPCVEETKTLFLKTLVRHLLCKGNAYIYKGRDAEGNVSWLELVSPSAISQVARDHNGRKLYYINGDRGGVFTDDQIIHIPYTGEGYNGTVGRSPCDVHKDIIKTYDILNEYVALYFNNGIGSKLVIHLGDKFEPGKANLEKLVQELNSYYKVFWSGSRNSGMPGILPPGTDAKFLEPTSNVQAQFNEAIHYYESLIYKLFNCPPEVIMSSENKYGSLQQKNADFLSSCIHPLCNHICECLMKGLDIDDNMFFSFTYDDLLETDVAQKTDRLVKAFNNGILTLNEVREQLNMSSIENEVEGNTRMVSASLIPFTQSNIEAILASSKLKLEEVGKSEVDVKSENGHNPVGRDMNL